jgi:twitching motility protein PilT
LNINGNMIMSAAIEDGSKLKQLMERAMAAGASDLHLTVGAPPILRISGKLSELREHPPLQPSDTEAMAGEMMSKERYAKFLAEREIDFACALGNSRFRVNAFHERGHIAIAMRLVPAEIKSLRDLGLPSIFERIAQAKQGFFLVTGPSGQGKTTTIAAIVEQMNRTRHTHIVTIEDPIEYRFENKKSVIQQREVGIDSLSFARALKSVVREDPNVIVVGEVRDLETVESALQLADTGHLVLATLHTSDCAHALGRIIDIFPQSRQDHIRNQFASVLLGISNQRLLHCLKGGRVPAVEILMANAAARNLIREKKEHQISSVIQTGASEGMVSLDHSLNELVESGSVEYEEAAAWSTAPGRFHKIAG